MKSHTWVIGKEGLNVPATASELLEVTKGSSESDWWPCWGIVILLLSTVVARPKVTWWGAAGLRVGCCTALELAAGVTEKSLVNSSELVQYDKTYHQLEISSEGLHLEDALPGWHFGPLWLSWSASFLEMVFLGCVSYPLVAFCEYNVGWMGCDGL